jgi:hypothetical protein
VFLPGDESLLFSSKVRFVHCQPNKLNITSYLACLELIGKMLCVRCTFIRFNGMVNRSFLNVSSDL